MKKSIFQIRMKADLILNGRSEKNIMKKTTTLTFTVNNTHEVSVPIPGVDLIPGTIGPFETESVFTISV